MYGADERSSIPFASLISQKGFENIYLMTGGIDQFVKIFPEKCDGISVQQLINAKLQEEIFKKDGKNFSHMFSTGKNE